MKSEIKPNKDKESSGYPKLMASEHRLVLFRAPRCGTLVGVVKPDNWMQGLGHHSDDWSMGLFTDFEDSVTLSN